MKDLRKTAKEILAKRYADENYCKEDIINAMLEMYQLDRPKPIPFDANDPSTFPKVRGLYWVKEEDGHWYQDRWIMGEAEPDKWDYMPMKLVTHYAEILMPE